MQLVAFTNIEGKYTFWHLNNKAQRGDFLIFHQITPTILFLYFFSFLIPVLNKYVLITFFKEALKERPRQKSMSDICQTIIFSYQAPSLGADELESYILNPSVQTLFLLLKFQPSFLSNVCFSYFVILKATLCKNTILLSKLMQPQTIKLHQRLEIRV